MKGQVTLEFVGAFIFFVLVVVAVLSLTVDEIPRFNSYADATEKNLELKRTTDLLLTSPGWHNNNSGGTDWENNVQSVEQPGLVDEEMYVQSDKLGALGTIGTDVYNYTSFVNDLELENSYNFRFTWFPLVETHNTFTRSNPPSDPDIEEPETDEYNETDNRVHYGEIDLNGVPIRFLVVAYSGNYNTTYVTDQDWDFQGRSQYGEGDVPAALTESSIGQDFVIESINNRENRPGASIVLKSDLGEFGRNNRTAEGNVEKLNRYALLEDPGSSTELMRMEVLAW